MTGTEPVKEFATLDVRPPKSSSVFIILVCLGFSAFFIVIGILEPLFTIPFFAFALFFLFILTRWFLKVRRPVTMRLNPEGITQILRKGTAVIPWNDIENFGIVVERIEYVAIRLKTTENYIASMSDAVKAELNEQARLGRHITYIFAKILRPISFMFRIFDMIFGTEFTDKIAEAEKIKNYVNLITYNRSFYGFDVLITWGELDRGVQEFILLLESYKQYYSK